MEQPTLANCNCCYKPISNIDIFCNSCGFPLQASESEQKNFIAIRANKEIDIVELNRKVESAR
ncbi:hypothetical protein, partial [Xanthomonas vasicola]|uniref:hypothetical protein n=1 Tax=Xanthomonas vasicola TaxID=56459 RepID=UPI001C83687B